MIPVAVALQLQLQLPLLLPHTIPAAVGSVLAVALAVGAELHGRRAYTGLAPDRVTRLWGHLIADAAPARGNAMRYRIRATAVAGGAQRAAADVELAVQVAAGPRLYRGQRVVLAGGRLGARGAATAMAVASTAAPLGFRSGTAAWRARVRAILERALARQGPRSGTLLRALLLGDRFAFDRRVTDAFRASGSMHLLALSGLHVGMAWAAASLLAGALRRPAIALAPEHARWWDAAAAVVGYVWLAGPRPSLLRAAAMAALAQAGRLRGDRPRGIEVLAAAAIVVLILEPSATTALSFLALAGILLLGPRITLHLPGMLPPALRGALGVAVGAQLFTFPLVLHSLRCRAPGRCGGRPAAHPAYRPVSARWRPRYGRRRRFRRCLPGGQRAAAGGVV